VEVNWAYGMASTVIAVVAVLVSTRLGSLDEHGATRYDGLLPWQWSLLSVLVAPVAALLLCYDLVRDARRVRLAPKQ